MKSHKSNHSIFKDIWLEDRSLLFNITRSTGIIIFHISTLCIPLIIYNIRHGSCGGVCSPPNLKFDTHKLVSAVRRFLSKLKTTPKAPSSTHTTSSKATTVSPPSAPITKKKIESESSSSITESKTPSEAPAPVAKPKTPADLYQIPAEYHWSRGIFTVLQELKSSFKSMRRSKAIDIHLTTSQHGYSLPVMPQDKLLQAYPLYANSEPTLVSSENQNLTAVRHRSARKQISFLDQNFHLVNIASDGRCFYRSVISSWLNNLVIEKETNPHVIENAINGTRLHLEDIHYDNLTPESLNLLNATIDILTELDKHPTPFFIFKHIMHNPSKINDLISFLQNFGIIKINPQIIPMTLYADDTRLKTKFINEAIKNIKSREMIIDDILHPDANNINHLALVQHSIDNASLLIQNPNMALKVLLPLLNIDNSLDLLQVISSQENLINDIQQDPFISSLYTEFLKIIDSTPLKKIDLTIKLLIFFDLFKNISTDSTRNDSIIKNISALRNHLHKAINAAHKQPIPDAEKDSDVLTRSAINDLNAAAKSIILEYSRYIAYSDITRQMLSNNDVTHTSKHIRLEEEHASIKKLLATLPIDFSTQADQLLSKIKGSQKKQPVRDVRTLINRSPLLNKLSNDPSNNPELLYLIYSNENETLLKILKDKSYSTNDKAVANEIISFGKQYSVIRRGAVRLFCKNDAEQRIIADSLTPFMPSLVKYHNPIKDLSKEEIATIGNAILADVEDNIINYSSEENLLQLSTSTFPAINIAQENLQQIMHMIEQTLSTEWEAFSTNTSNIDIIARQDPIYKIYSFLKSHKHKIQDLINYKNDLLTLLQELEAEVSSHRSDTLISDFMTKNISNEYFLQLAKASRSHEEQAGVSLLTENVDQQLISSSPGFIAQKLLESSKPLLLNIYEKAIQRTGMAEGIIVEVIQNELPIQICTFVGSNDHNNIAQIEEQLEKNGMSPYKKSLIFGSHPITILKTGEHYDSLIPIHH